ncbi:MAG: hypothetical protein KJ955_04280 [Nanoarchaeota archaeon]|nr:hypothetical protein [Nanoarchaeota archaeon]
MAKRAEKAKEPNSSDSSENLQLPKVRGNSVSDITMAKLAEALIETNIALQHKVADLILNMKDVNKSVRDMVTLFTEAGEHIKKGKYEDPLLVKLDGLLEQNKNIAKGLLLLERFVKEKQASTTGFGRPFQKTEL